MGTIPFMAPERGRWDGGRRSSRREFGWDGVELELARWHPGPDSDGLVCVDVHMLFVTLSGRTLRTETEIDGGDRYRGADFPGAVSFIPAGHRRRARHEGGWIDYAAVRLDADAPAFAGGGTEFVGFTNRPDPLIHQLALALRDEAHSRGVAGELFVESVAATLGRHLVRRYSTSAPPQPRVPRALGGAALAKVVGHIRDNLDAELRLDTLAEVAGMDRHRFGRAFKEATGTPPHRYVTDRRVERAAVLLARSDLPIGEIAHRVGLSSQSHLTTLFRTMRGTTPNAYRRAHRT